MPIPSPADFRNKTKKHSEVREMLAQMAENVAEKGGLIALSNETGLTDSKLLFAVQILVDTIANYLIEYDINFTSIRGDIETNLAKQLLENSSIKTNIVNLLVGFQHLTETLHASHIEIYETFANKDQFIQSAIADLFMGVSNAVLAIVDTRDDLDEISAGLRVNINEALKSVNSNTAVSASLYSGMQIFTAALADLASDVNELVPTQEQKLASLKLEQEKMLELSKLHGFDPDKAGNNSITAQNLAILPKPDELIRIDVETEFTLPTAKGVVIQTTNILNVNGNLLRYYGTLEVQGSSSAGFPKKNWTLAFFKDEARTQAVSIKLGPMIAQEELVFKSNFVDNTHCRNIAVNRLWDQMQLARQGWPKREPDFVNTVGGVGLAYQPTGATGHVDGFPAVMYINEAFYGLGCLNIGKKRDNYNLKKDSQKHIQLDPEGSVNLYSLPATPYDPAASNLTAAAFDVRRPSNWGEEAQGYYDRLKTFLKMSKSGMEAAGIDNYIDRASMVDYIILCQVCDLWDHLHKNTLYTTWNGNIWHFLPYDVDTVFGLHFTGVYYDADGVTELHPATTLRIPAAAGNNSWGTLAKFRLIYGAEIDARYAELRNKNIISVENILSICENLTRKYPTALFEAEDARWNLVPGGTIYQTLQQSGSLHQIYTWLSVRIPVCDSYFNYQPTE